MADKPQGFFEGTEMPTAGWWEALFPDPAGLLGTVGVRTGATVIDLCSGDGWFTAQLARIAQQVTAIDIDGRMLDVARARLAERGLTNVTFVRGNAYDVARLVPRPADFVFLANALHGVPDRPRLASAVRSILAPDGRFSVVNWHQRPREETMVLGEPRGPRTELRMSLEETLADVESAGLKSVEVVDVPPYHYGAVFRNSPKQN